MNATDFLDAHRIALSGLVFWIIINVKAVRLMSRAKDSSGPLPDAIDGSTTCSPTQHF
ncbi:MAG TPA: hypothetical protein VHZ99_00100 [Steroidobacteraceae bacterium]|jgi:hypothetical protein|nr:hypothetical protein [Steroidobacteraceae bacterium]